MNPNDVVRRAGGIASRTTLNAAGCSDRSIRRRIADGSLLRLRPGWFALPSAPRDVMAAVRAGGRLTCISALRRQGVWTMPNADLHVAMSRGRPRAAGVRVHWTDGPTPPGYPMDQPEPAIHHLIRCADLRSCVVALDSALHRNIVAREAMSAILGQTPRGRRIETLLDPASESGIETLARLELRRLRLRVTTQVPVADVGTVDLLIGDRLILEVDGEAWHDRESTFEKDRARDRALIAAGYLVMRATYRQVMHRWPEVEREILAVVRRNSHRWPSGRR